MLRSQTDARLVDLTRDGNERAFEAIVQRYRRPLLRYCSRLLPATRAEDAVQQAFLSAHRAIHAGDAELNLRPWLYRIAHNASLNLLRQNGFDHDQVSEEIDGVETPPQAFERGERLRTVVAAVRDLPARQRDAIVLQAVEGRSYDEIAEELGVSDGAVRQLLNRARHTLREGAAALTPSGLLTRLASNGGEATVVERVAQAVAGAGGGALLTKAGATLVIAGAVAGGAATGGLPGGGGHNRDAAGGSGAVVAAAPSAGGVLGAPGRTADVALTGRDRGGVQRGSSSQGAGNGPRGGGGSSRGGNDGGSSRGGDDRTGGGGGSGTGSSPGDDGGGHDGGSGDRSGSGSASGDDRSGPSADDLSDHGGGSHSGPGSSDGDSVAAPATDDSSHSGSDTPDSGTSDSGLDDPPDPAPTTGGLPDDSGLDRSAAGHDASTDGSDVSDLGGSSH